MKTGATTHQAEEGSFFYPVDPVDEMGRTTKQLLSWMTDVAEARLDGSKKTVNMKFTVNTLRQWVDRSKKAITA